MHITLQNYPLAPWNSRILTLFCKKSCDSRQKLEKRLYPAGSSHARAGLCPAVMRSFQTFLKHNVGNPDCSVHCKWSKYFTLSNWQPVISMIIFSPLSFSKGKVVKVKMSATCLYLLQIVEIYDSHHTLYQEVKVLKSCWAYRVTN